MKLLAVTQEHAKKPVVRITYGAEAVFFSGEQPRVPQMIALELPELDGVSQTKLLEWLEKHGHKRLERSLWRDAVIDDLLDAHNGGDMIWHVAHHFTLAEIATFSERHGPKLLAETKAALAAERSKRASVLRKLEKRTSRILPVTYAGMTRVPIEAMQLELEDDRAEIAKLDAAPFDANQWIDVCWKLKTEQVKREMLGTIGQKLVATGANISDALHQMCRRGLDQVWSNELWAAIANHVVLEQTVTGEAIDLTKATEVTVTASWGTWKARRIGPIKFGRAALAVVDGNQTTYVRGERKLLHRIRARGGKLERWGNTLVVGGKRGVASAHEKLLEVDRIDTLAQVDPAAAARLAGDLTATDPIAGALARAMAEPTLRRILADLLIERLVGIDADVARRLARAQARANRR